MKPPYSITNKILSLYGQIAEALGVSKGILLAKPEAKLRRQNRIKTIYSSLAIEGNTLSLEYVTALLNNKRVIGRKKDIVEVQNAIQAYHQLGEFDPFSVDDFLKAHGVLMSGLVEHSGKFRISQVGIMAGKRVSHVAPPHGRVPYLMQELFEYVKHDEDLDIIKSCVFHYEMEFIHPFEDGNGRMGRYWQTRLLMNVNPIFEYVPVEEVIRDRQKEYYNALAVADNMGSSTVFIEFMLGAINKSLRKTIEEAKAPAADYSKRVERALSMLNGWFDRKEYMNVNKGISPATASRDLKQLLEEGVVVASGAGRITKYRKNTDKIEEINLKS
jgi:Fic family protein